MNCVYIGIEVMGEEMLWVLLVRMKDVVCQNCVKGIWQQQVHLKLRSLPMGLVCVKARSPQSENHPP